MVSYNVRIYIEDSDGLQKEPEKIFGTDKSIKTWKTERQKKILECYFGTNIKVKPLESGEGQN